MKNIYAIALLVIVPILLIAQNATSELSGVVTTKEGKVVANTNVSILDQSGENVIGEAITNANGEYTVQLVPGEYRAVINGEFIQNINVPGPGNLVIDDTVLLVAAGQTEAAAATGATTTSSGVSLTTVGLATVGFAGAVGGGVLLATELDDDENDASD